MEDCGGGGGVHILYALSFLTSIEFYIFTSTLYKQYFRECVKLIIPYCMISFEVDLLNVRNNLSLYL